MIGLNNKMECSLFIKYLTYPPKTRLNFPTLTETGPFQPSPIFKRL